MQSLQANHEFIVLRDLYDEVKRRDGSIATKLVKKNIRTKVRVYLQDIYMVEEIVNARGVADKTKCGINIKEKGFMVVKEPFEKVNSLIFGDQEPKEIGFKCPK